MPTFEQMADETIAHLSAFSADQAQKTTLTVGIDADDVALTVANPDRVVGGVIEIDEELIEVDTVDALGGAVTAFGWGRAQQGTTAAAHSAGARITISPRWPRARVKRVLNEVLAGLWPDLFGVVVDETNTTSFIETSYPLPANCRRVIDVQWEAPGTPLYWVGVRSWRLDLAADTTAFPTGVSLVVAEPMHQGRTLKVVYAKEPSALTSSAQDFASTTGLPDSCSDLVCLGAASRLVLTAELARTQPFTSDHAYRLQDQPAGAAASAARYLQQQYQVRLETERDRLYGRYPIKIRRTWT